MAIPRRIAAMTAAIAMIAATALPAVAQTDAPTTDRTDPVQDTASHLDRAKAWLESAIERRLEQVDRLQEHVRSSDSLAPEHAAQLTSELSRAQGGLRSLLPEVARAETAGELRAIANEMVEDYRIYVLMTPKTFLTVASDHGVALAERGTAHSSAIAEAARRAEAEGLDVSGVWALLARAEESIAAGLSLIDPVAEQVLPLQPADYPDPAQGVLEDAHADAVAARAEYHDAVDALREAEETLREIVRGR